MPKINLAVIFGGQSGEHEVSLSSAKSVMKALNKDKYNIIPIAITKKGNWLIGAKGAEYMKLNASKAGKENAISQEESQKLVTVADADRDLTNYMEGASGSKIDLVLPIMHGPYCEDGRLQGMLDMLGVKYVFSGVLAHALGMNKSKAKIMAQTAGIPVAQEIIINKKSQPNYNDIIKQLSFPVVIKPLELGSSVGISIAKNKSELTEGILNAFSHGGTVMLEQYIKGREFTVTVVDNPPEALAVIEIIPQVSDFYDYKAKYEDGGSKHVCPADLPDDARKKIQAYAVKVFKSLDCKDLARADFIWDENTKDFYFIDINTIPGMTKTSLAPEAAKASGMEFGEFLDRLINFTHHVI